MNRAGSILRPACSLLSVVTLRQHAVLCAVAALGGVDYRVVMEAAELPSVQP